MSGGAAIAEVTSQLRSVLAAQFNGGFAVTTTALHALPDPGQDDSRKLNLLLYQILPNAGRMNAELPWRPGVVPLALDLRYLLTAIETDQPKAQLALGTAMQFLNDNPVLWPRGASTPPFERVRISLRPLQLDELEKLWAGSPSPWRLSVAYDVSVVLIEPQRSPPQPLPVIRRRIVVRPELAPRIDTIEIGAGPDLVDVLAPRYIRPLDLWLKRQGLPGRNVAEVGDVVVLSGEGLSRAQGAIIASLRFPGRSVTLPIEPRRDAKGGLIVILDGKEIAQRHLPAGPCGISILFDDTRQQTNLVPLLLAPRIKPDWNGDAPLVGSLATILVAPPILPGQKVEIRLEETSIVPRIDNGRLVFPFPALASGDYLLRIRVDGVDNLAIDPTVAVDEATVFGPLVRVS